MSRPKLSEVDITIDGVVGGSVILNGIDITSKVIALQFDASGDPAAAPTLTLEYACYEQTTIEGKVDVVHVCPKGGRGK